MFERFVAGQLACMRELTLFYAPHVNSYKRFAEGSFAPTAVAWGNDNRTCSMRVVGHGQALRVENRLPGRRRQPLPGARGDDRRRPARDRRTSSSSSPPLEGNAYASDKPHVPTNIYEARDLFAASEVAREAFGQEVVDHYLNRAQVELDGVRGGGHRLGALPGVRAAVRLGRGHDAPRSGSRRRSSAPTGPSGATSR